MDVHIVLKGRTDLKTVILTLMTLGFLSKIADWWQSILIGILFIWGGKKRDFVISCFSCQFYKQRCLFFPRTEFSDHQWHILSAAEMKNISQTVNSESPVRDRPGILSLFLTLMGKAGCFYVIIPHLLPVALPCYQCLKKLRFWIMETFQIKWEKEMEIPILHPAEVSLPNFFRSPSDLCHHQHLLTLPPALSRYRAQWKVPCQQLHAIAKDLCWFNLRTNSF